MCYNGSIREIMEDFMKLNLSGKEWTLSNAGTRTEISGLQMNVPGDVHSALIRGGVISDPYWECNERDVQWVGKESWSISRPFDFKKEKGCRSYLCMSMADTFFTVLINGRKAGSGDNYFRIWRFDVTSLLKDGENTITVIFDSAEKHAIAESKKLPYPIPYSKYDVYSPHRNLVRKIQCHSGWDWGPCLMAFGIYGEISLETVRDGYLESVTVETNPQKKDVFGGEWKLSLGIRYFSLRDGDADFVISLCGNGLDFSNPLTASVHEGENKIFFDMRIENPVLWKSSDELKDCGMDENPLYTLQVAALKNTDGISFEDTDYVAMLYENQDSMIEKKIGFRTLVLRSKPDKNGCALYYELNGRPVFAKGANWIPLDALPERWTKNRLWYFLKSCVEANMNSIRFWGGGQYESDECYDLCDHLGLIVWQDCAFGCSLYPAGDAFLSSVEKELEDNIYRLQSHPSLAVWCGNNEDFGALTWYPESRENRDRYLVDYDRLNHGTVEKTVRRCDPSRAWWPSSPCAGPDNFGDNWHNDGEGDMHFWSVWHEKKDMEAYLSIKPRFVSEFGYESFPSMEGVLEYASKENTNLTSPVMEWHQRSPGGNSIILENFSRYFRFPSGIKNMLYLSQVQQALAVKTAVDYWRSLRPHCMGATYWQLNDVWPVASWSSLEYSGKWKLLHYAARRFFNRVAVSLVKKESKVFLNLVNESVHDLIASFTLRILDFDGNDLCAPMKLGGIKSASDSSVCVWDCGFDEIPVDVSLSECFMYVEMVASDAGKKSEVRFTGNDTLFFERWKKCDIRKSHVSAAVSESGGKISIRLDTDLPAFFVSLDVPGIRGFFSDNMLTLIPGKAVDIDFIPSDYGLEKKSRKITAAMIKKSLDITTLRDSYE